jgi:two-component system chemotaxis sensor kinase CheA
VDHEKLDHLMNLIGELIINRNRFVMLTKQLEENRDLNEMIQFFYETTDALGRISDDLQDTIMQVRMVPVRTVFSRFPRLVRDLSRKSGKKIDLIIEGEDTELDKSLVEVIGDPILHLIRNAVDHGQETPEERRAAGKPEVGKVWLRAFHEGNSVIIEVEDDGRGIDPEKIKKKAIEKGIINPEEAEKMDDREAIDLIFAPGFSTAEKVTDVSGRGVGMDVVRNNIKSLNGNVFVHSEVGKGTKFILSLPLTLAIIEALLVEVGTHTYAIPLDAVSETTKIETSKICEVNKRKTTTLRGEVVGLVELGEILGISNGKKDDRDILPLVIISVNDRKVGLIVDTLLHRQEIVIKSMGEYLGDIHGFAGATILGDGRVILILDPNEVMSIATSLKRG